MTTKRAYPGEFKIEALQQITERDLGGRTCLPGSA